MKDDPINIVEFATIGASFVQTANKILHRMPVQLLSARELPLIDNKNPDEMRLSGQFVIKVAKPGKTPPSVQIARMKRAALLVAQSKPNRSPKEEPLAPYVPAFQFGIPPVNYPTHMPYAWYTLDLANHGCSSKIILPEMNF